MRKIALLLAGFMTVFSLAACSQLDVVGKDSTRALEAVFKAVPPQEIAWEVGPAWALNAPDGASMLEIFWDENTFSAFDLALEVDSEPFVKAGLDIEKLDGGWVYQSDNLTYRLDLENSGPAEYATPINICKEIVKNHRDIVGYHAELDHYNIDIGGGNMFEWAKNMDTNDKDIVFVLNPEPFITAGVDPNNVEGWVFAKVKTMDGEVDKFLKPFNLR